MQCFVSHLPIAVEVVNSGDVADLYDTVYVVVIKGLIFVSWLVLTFDRCCKNRIVFISV